jgi:hydrogenase nickel incorporation protein HypA/HybF
VHEYSIVEALVSRVEEEAHRHADPRVLGLRVRVGELAGVDEELLRTAWSLFREGTCCAEAELEITPEPACWGCPDCGEPIAPGAALRCPRCALPAHLSAGDALVLERIEMEVDDV